MSGGYQWSSLCDTTVTEMVVDDVQQKKASEGLQSFMQDVNGVQRCLDEVINQRGEILGGDHWDTAEGAARVVSAGGGIGFSVRMIFKARKAARISRIASQAAK